MRMFWHHMNCRRIGDCFGRLVILWNSARPARAFYTNHVWNVFSPIDNPKLARATVEVGPEAVGNSCVNHRGARLGREGKEN